MKATLLLIFAFYSTVVFGQTFNNVSSTVVAVQNSSTTWGDYDNDGDLDLVITGTILDGTNQVGITYLYNNDGNGSLILVDTTSFPGMYNGYVEWADFNQDNLLDLLVVGFNTDLWEESSRIYQNLGNGSFSQMSAANLTPVQSASAVCDDFDNDGDVDVFISGNGYAVGLGKYACMYFNNGDGTFTSLDSFLGVTGGTTVASGDFDGDGDIDLIYSGIHLSPGRITKYYTNQGNGTFSDNTVNTFFGVHAGCISPADYDNDGDLDILISGWEESNYPKARLYENTGDGLFQENTSVSFIGMLNCDISWGDYDVDGDMDILMTGSGKNNTQIYSLIYTNEGGGNFNELIGSSIQEVYTGTCDWVDIDNDADLDIFVSGKGNGQTDLYSLIYHNENSVSNGKPTAPTDLTTIINGDEVTMSWERATDDATPQNSLSYNYYIRRIEDDVYSCTPSSNISDGYRKVIRYGNTSIDTSWTIKNLIPGTYQWSIQSIDHGYTGSPFAEEQVFKVEDFLELFVSVYPIPSYNNLTLNVQSPFTGDMNVAMYNSAGQKVYDKSYPIIKNVDWNHEIQLPELESGSYSIVVAVNKEILRLPVIILGGD